MKDIKGYEGLYAITENGEVWSYISNKFMKQFDNGQGYMYVKLFKDGKQHTKRVNILVAEAYLEPHPEDGQKYLVDHIDETDRKNNHYTNLQWLTYSENLQKANMRRPRPRIPVRCVETGEVFANQAEAARAIGKHRYGINSVLKGKQKTCGGYHWEYAV